MAWGNAIGDGVVNIVLSMRGYTSMALGAVVGAPIISMCLGVGIPMTQTTIEFAPDPQPLPSTPFLLVASVTLIFALVSHAIVLPATRWKLPNWYGVCNIILYMAFLLIAILIGVEVIEFSV